MAITRWLLYPLACTMCLSLAKAQTVPNQAPHANATSQYASPSNSSAANVGNASTNTPAGYDPLLDLPPLPKGKVSLVGGIVTSVDQIRDQLKVQPFGAKNEKIYFDQRTHIYRNGRETTQLAIRKGDRVYVDTDLDGTRLFARNIRIVTQAVAADARGLITNFDSTNGELLLQDEISQNPIKLHVDSSTSVTKSGERGSISDLTPGSLVTITFAPGKHGGQTARQVAILAAPGTSFTFLGRITYLNLSSRTLGIENESDKRTYDIGFNPNLVIDRDKLHEGSNASVHAVFTGKGYRADNVQVLSSNSQ